MSITIRVPMEPKVASRPRFRKDGRTYQDPDYRLWLEQAAILLRSAWKKAGQTTLDHDQHTRVDLTLYPDRFEVTITDSQHERSGTLRGDIDNYAKAVLDALQGANVFANDKQVTELNAKFGGP